MTAAYAAIPLKWIGPIKILDGDHTFEFKAPLATFETTLWPSTSRGAKISRLTTGIQVTLFNDMMTRSIVLEAASASDIKAVYDELPALFADLKQCVAATSRFARLEEIHPEVVGHLLYLRFAFATGDAAGHNMTTKASDALIEFLCGRFPKLKYVSISANLCTDKKVSAINGILGRGKSVIAEIIIPKAICEQHLRTTPAALCALNTKKNLLGSILAGSLRSANAHYANLLLAFYLATGQDAANIVEGSQGITYCDITESGALYFSVTLPNIIVGTVGNGKHLDWVQENLVVLASFYHSPSAAKGTGRLQHENSQPSESQRLAKMIAATVLCGELSLLAAQSNRGELTQSHMIFERKQP